MSETKLIPCPFCGERPSETGNNLIGIVIACRTPNCAPEPLVSARNRAGAYRAWNTRAPDPCIAAAEALAEALGGARTQLNYVGYGDAWEREGTEELREQISAALAAWEKASR